jgi:hypothetical protein
LIFLHHGGHILNNQSAVIQHSDPIAQAHDQFDVMFDQQNGRPVAANAVDQVAQFGGFRTIHAGRRLIQTKQLRLGRQRAGDFQPALVAIGQIFGQIVSRSSIRT